MAERFRRDLPINAGIQLFQLGGIIPYLGQVFCIWSFTVRHQAYLVKYCGWFLGDNNYVYIVYNVSSGLTTIRSPRFHVRNIQNAEYSAQDSQHSGQHSQSGAVGGRVSGTVISPGSQPYNLCHTWQTKCGLYYISTAANGELSVCYYLNDRKTCILRTTILYRYFLVFYRACYSFEICKDSPCILLRIQMFSERIIWFERVSKMTSPGLPRLFFFQSDFLPFMFLKRFLNFIHV